MSEQVHSDASQNYKGPIEGAPKDFQGKNIIITSGGGGGSEANIKVKQINTTGMSSAEILALILKKK